MCVNLWGLTDLGPGRLSWVELFLSFLGIPFMLEIMHDYLYIYIEISIQRL